MIKEHQPMIISLNELGSHTDMKSIQHVLLGYDIIKAESTNKHGGALVAIDKRIRCVPINLNQLNIAAAIITLNDSTYTITSIYSPSNTPLPLKTMSLLLTYSNHTILLGDFNAKHIDWGCSTTNPKGAQLLKWINDNNLIIHNTNMSTSLRSSNIIDLIISNQQRDSIDCTSLPYTCSDHFPIFIEFSNILPQCKVTVWTIQNQLRSTLPPSIQILLKYKHYLQNRYRKTKLENDRLDLRLWSKIKKQEILNYKARQWTSFLSKLASPNPKTFCNHVKLLNKKPKKGFSGITDDDNMNIYKTPASILSYFQ
ncbi:unnamed protein product [Rotaria sp. Silwood1]|nr:unnamed protein product [Rotaria sp. Silwood1]